MTKTIIFMNILFIVITLPGAIVTLDFNSLIVSQWGLLLIKLADALVFSYHGLNFYIFYVSNNRFKSEFKKLFGKEKKRPTTSGN
jgi:CDP-diglyceride synthetase